MQLIIVPTSNDPLEVILDFYLKTVSVNKKSYKTEIYRMRSLKNLLGKIKFNEITPLHMISYRDHRLSMSHPRSKDKTLSGATVKLELMLMSHVFNTAITEWGMEDIKNPILKIKKPKVNPGRTRRLSEREEKALLNGALKHQNTELYAIIVIALETAMRQGEILFMEWENINWDKRTAMLPITKNGESREVPLSRAAFEILKNYLTPQKDGRIFTYSSSGLKSTWRDLVNILKIENFHFHDLRHCAISSLLERGLNSIEVASISGHKSMAMLKRYAHIQSYKLVEKLDPKFKAKKERPLLKSHFPPYPAIITRSSKKVFVEFPDFIDLRAAGRNEDKTVWDAQTFLLKKIVYMLCEGITPPVPSSIDYIIEKNIKNGVIQYISPIEH